MIKLKKHTQFTQMLSIMLITLIMCIELVGMVAYADNDSSDHVPGMPASAVEASEQAKKEEEAKKGNGKCTGPHIQQWGGNPVIHSSGCTVLTLQMMMQNSGVISDKKYQLSERGNYVNTTDKFSGDNVSYAEWDSYIGGLAGSFQSGSGDGWTVGNLPSTVSALSGGTITATRIGGDALTTVTADSYSGFVSMGGKMFEDMSAEEITEVLKVFYEAGYWCAVGVWYNNDKSTNNSSGGGGAGQGANHMTLFAGFDDSGTAYLYDSGSGTYTDKDNGDYTWSIQQAYTSKYAYRVSYILAWEFSNGKMMDNLGGHSQAANVETAEEIGISNMITTNGYYDETDLMAYSKLSECNIDDMYLADATLNNLNDADVQSINSWLDNTDYNSADKGFRGVLRKLIQLLGICLTLWSLFFYIAYWFDRLNNFFDIDLVHILSFGQFKISPDEDESTFKTKNIGKGEMTVNHRNVLSICVISIVFGTLLMTGTIYKLVKKLALWIMHILGKR